MGQTNFYKRIVLGIGVIFISTLILSSFLLFQNNVKIPTKDMTYSGYQGNFLYGGAFFEASYKAKEPFVEQGILTVNLAFHNFLNVNITKAEISKLQIFFVFADQIHNELNYTLIQTMNANFTLLPSLRFENSQDFVIPYEISFPLDSKELGIQILGNFQIFSANNSKTYNQQDMVQVNTNIPLIDRISFNTDPGLTFLIISQLLVVFGCFIILYTSDIHKTWILLVLGLSLFTTLLGYPIINIQPVHEINDFNFKETYYIDNTNTKISIQSSLLLSPLVDGEYFNGSMNFKFQVESNYTYTGMKLKADFISDRAPSFSSSNILSSVMNITKSTDAELFFRIDGFTYIDNTENANLKTHEEFLLDYTFDLIRPNGSISELSWGIPDINFYNSTISRFICPIYANPSTIINDIAITLFFSFLAIYSISLNYLKRKMRFYI